MKPSNKRSVYIKDEIIALMVQNPRGLSASIADTVLAYNRLKNYMLRPIQKSIDKA